MDLIEKNVGADWIRVALDGGQWRALVKLVTNFLFHKRHGIYGL
jgi:hypothetical protein